jgi:hypothetical protein
VAGEPERYLPFLATTKVLMGAVRAGVGREQAHEAIKEHAVAVALQSGRVDHVHAGNVVLRGCPGSGKPGGADFRGPCRGSIVGGYDG